MKLPGASVKRLALLIIFVVPAAAWALVKPVRLVTSELMGLSCEHTAVCVEEPSQRPVADALYAESLSYVSGAVAPVQGLPMFIFCSTDACANKFGLGARSAVTVGTFGTVIGPRAWKSYYVRHELIHHLQGQQLGVLRLLLAPRWFVEGMAYALSGDPRQPLAEPWEECRGRFNKWYATVAKERLWQEAGKL